MALPELLANSPVPGSRTPLSTLGAAITDPAAVTITTAGAAPSALQGTGQFRIVIDSEILIVTAGASGTTWTVVRGAEGSTAATHANGTSVFHYLTVGGLGAMFVPTAWDSGTFYPVGKPVFRANALFICIQAHTNHDPLTDCATVLSGTYWEFVSLRGAVENYVSGGAGGEQVTSTSFALATTPDQATVFCPSGLLSFAFTGQWKLTGSPIANSFAKVQVDGSDLSFQEINAGANTSATFVATLQSTGTFWGVIGHSASSVSGATVGGALNPTASASADATVPAVPQVIGASGAGAGATPVRVGVGVHTVSVLWEAGNGTTTVNVRERYLKAIGS